MEHRGKGKVEIKQDSDFLAWETGERWGLWNKIEKLEEETNLERKLILRYIEFIKFYVLHLRALLQTLV